MFDYLVVGDLAKLVESCLFAFGTQLFVIEELLKQNLVL